MITGGHSGIGLETTRVLAKAIALVCVGARDMRKARNNLANTGKVEVIHLDLADSGSVDRFADRVNPPPRLTAPRPMANEGEGPIMPSEIPSIRALDGAEWGKRK